MSIHSNYSQSNKCTLGTTVHCPPHPVTPPQSWASWEMNVDMLYCSSLNTELVTRILLSHCSKSKIVQMASKTKLVFLEEEVDKMCKCKSICS